MFLSTILDKIKDGKMVRFGSWAASSLIWEGEGWGGGWWFAVPFYFVQDCSLKAFS